METGIQIVWWIGLIIALIMTLAILKGAFQIVNVLKDIYQLSEVTLTAAAGIRSNLSSVRQMDALHIPAQNLQMAAASLNTAAGEIEEQLNALTGGFFRKGD
jgi:anaerobic ribonucleoside-triphosphate reductase